MNIILKPVISEKSFAEAAKGSYTFIVDTSSNKDMIKEAVESEFKVTVMGVSTSITKGKTVKLTRLGKRVKKFATKKARVKLKKGEKIDLFEEVKK